MKTIKKTILIFTFLILHFTFFIRLSAADTWVKTYRPFQEPYMEDKYYVEDVIVTQDSGYVVSGSFELYDDFYYERWGFLMKTDSDGNMLWASKDSVDFMSDNGDFVDFVETSDGDFLTIGSRIPSGGYMLKRDSEGNRLWAQSYTSFGTKSMSNTGDNNIIIGGVVNSNIALRKIDNNGNTLWAKSYDCGNFSMANSIKETSEGDYIMTGLASGNGYDIIVMKTDSVGDSLWKRTFDGCGEHDEGNCIIDTNDGNILVGGVIGAPYPIYGYGFLSYLDPNGDTLCTKNIPATVFSPFLSLYDDITELTAYGGCYGESKMIKIDYSGNISYEKLIYGYRPSGDKSFQKIEGGYIFLSRPGSHNYKITLTKTDNNGNFLSIDDNPIISNEIINAYPNPFYSSINIQYILPYQIKDCNITIYNIKGELVKKLQLSKDNLLSGNKTWDGTSFDGKEVHNGIYFLKLEGDNYRAVKKVTKIK
jgi:hypothetical protein